ncbi:MAG: hypothetical protein WCK35_16120 [Chloroflexota bacterium]
MISTRTRTGKTFTVLNRIQLIVLEERSSWKAIDQYELANWGGQDA